MIPCCPWKILEMQYVILKRDGSFPIERTTSSHAPSKIKNTQDEHEARQAPSVGKLPSLRKARNIQKKAIRGGRKGRQLRKRRLRERKRRVRLRKRLPKSGCVM